MNNQDLTTSVCNLTLTDPEFSSYFEGQRAKESKLGLDKDVKSGGVKLLSDYKMKNL